MGFNSQFRGYALSEESYIVSILSAEAVKASQTAYWLTQIPVAKVSTQTVKDIVGQVRDIENAVSSALRTAADKEVAIAAKLNAINCEKDCLKWVQAPCPVVTPAEEGASNQVSANLLVNGDFETGTFSPWSATSPGASVTIVTGGGAPNPYSGLYVAQMFQVSVNISQTIFNITGGIPVTLAFGVLGSVAQTRIRVNLDYRQGTTLISSDTRDILLSPSNNYITLYYIYPVPSGADNIVLTFTRLDSGSGYIAIDNVVLRV